jgi:hypothetical protein
VQHSPTSSTRWALAYNRPNPHANIIIILASSQPCCSCLGVCVCACGFLCAEVENRDLHADGGTRSACRSSATARHRQRDVGRVCALQTSFKGRVFMTHATKAIYHMMLSDFIRVSKVHLSLRLLSVALN